MRCEGSKRIPWIKKVAYHEIFNNNISKQSSKVLNTNKGIVKIMPIFPERYYFLESGATAKQNI